MAISYPRTDILSGIPVADQVFQLVSRQEYSRLASGVTRGKDLGPALWMATYTTDVMDIADAVAYEAALNSLDGVVNTFTAFDLRRPYPRSSPSGSFGDTGILHSVNANNKALSISGLDAGFVLSVGDYLCFDYSGSRALHQVMEAVTADGAGLTAEFEVRPFIRSGWSLSAAITLKNPSGVFTLMPGSVTSKMSGPVNSVVSFQAGQFL